ncbi:CRAL/TRIO domain-containing protein [Crassisporium funariophilum]|nr:CRAL/TRIO domain-containing protein [Crassisporium funariophilum]
MGEQSSSTSNGGPNVAHDLAGHLYNLTPQQEQAFAAFKEDLTKAGLYTPSTEPQEPPYDDATLLRFLRARSFNPSAAQKQFADSEEWRAKHNVKEVYRNASAEDIEHSTKFYPRWTGRRDKLGLPLYVYRLASLEPIQHELDAISAETRFHRLIALYERMTRFTFPLCSHLPHPTSPTPISSTTTIIDLEDVSFGSMWRLRNVLQEASKLSTANYPETLHVIAIVNSPSFFPTIWNWIKGWFDEGTRRKIHVLGRDPGSTLRDLVEVHNLPTPYGGELQWNFGDEPDLDEDTKSLIGELPKGPVVFVNGAVALLST